MKLAEDSPGEQLIFVTNDSDFMDETQDDLHSDLSEDLVGIVANDRVTLVKVLSDVAVRLADRSSEDSDLRSLRAELQDDSVRRLVESLTQTVVNMPLDPRRCALPRGTIDSFIQYVDTPKGLSYSVKGGLAVGRGVAEFSFEAQTTIVLVLPEGASPQRFEATLPGPAGETLFVSVKALMYHRLLRLGRYDTPLDGEISLIDAKKDDPGRGEWRRGDPYSSQAMQEMLRNLNVNPMQGMLRNLNVNPMQEMPENQSGGAEPDPDDGNGEGPANTEP